MALPPPIRIYPSLLAADFSRLGEEVARVEAAGADGLHLDVMDGHFVPNLTVGPPVAESIRRLAKSRIDCHIMVTDPLAVARWFAEAGVDAVTFHAEVTSEPKRVVDAIRGFGKGVGVAINPDTPASAVKPYLPLVDLVLLMTVFPGFGGQSFMSSVIPKIRQVRELGFAGDVQVDGGITDETGALCAAAGANVFVAGTYVFRSPDAGASIRALRARAEAARMTAPSVK